MFETKQRSIDPGGPGQSGAASGKSHFDESKPGEQRYPAHVYPNGSRSRWDSDAAAPANSEDQLRSTIFSSLREAQINVSNLEVIIADGVVTLIGTVDDGPSVSLAQDRVDRIAGVDEVRNLILVEGR